MIQEVKTSSGIPVREVYTGPVTEAALPGIFPYTRGIQADMYRRAENRQYLRQK